MQGQNLLQINSVEGENQSCLKALSTEKYAMSPSEYSCRTGSHHLNQNRNLDASLEMELVQKKIHSKSDDGTIDEGSLEILQDINTMESSNTWGDFEGFSEVKLVNLSNIPEPLEKINEKVSHTNGMDINDTHSTTSFRKVLSKAVGYEKETIAKAAMKVAISSEDAVKQSFPEIPVPQCLDKISTLKQVLHPEREDADIPECTEKQTWLDSAKLWKTLTQCNSPSDLRCHQSEFHCQENLLAVLGINANQKAVPEFKVSSLEKTNRENEESGVDKFNLSTCKALIQTKLSVTPEPRQNHLFTYNLFLKKTPSSANMQYITVSQKKRFFTAQSLRMKIFSSNVC
uniref:Putative C14orf79-like protein n=1 Tax=Agkistrodon contortrix contortrix TaxID=8713 RepID=A0A1W7RJ00_AGKCO